jgi:hypothetical protein
MVFILGKTDGYIKVALKMITGMVMDNCMMGVKISITEDFGKMENKHRDRSIIFTKNKLLLKLFHTRNQYQKNNLKTKTTIIIAVRVQN